MIGLARRYLDAPGLGPALVVAVLGSAGLRMSGMAFGFLIGVQLARGLGAGGYGIYGIAMALVTLVGVPTEFGLPQLVTREVAAAQVNAEWGRLHGILRWSTRVVLMLSGVFSAAVLGWELLSGRNLGSPSTLTLSVGLFMLPFVGLGKLRGATLCGLQHLIKGQLPDALIRPAVFSALLFLVPWIWVPLSPALAMGLAVISAAIAFAVATAMVRVSLPRDSHALPPSMRSRAWWTSALPMALTEGMRTLQGNVIVLLLGLMSTVEVAGVFRVASSLALLIGVPITLLNVVGAPVMSRLHTQGDMARLQRMLSWMSAAMTVGTIALVLPFLVGGDYLLARIFGSEFAAANTPLLILGLGIIACAIFGASAVLLNMTGREKRVTRASAIMLVALLLLAVPLVSLYGAIGGATAGAAAMALWCGLMWHDARRLLGLDTSLMSLSSLRSNAP